MKPFTISHKNSIDKKTPSGGFARLGAVLFWLAVWQLGSMALGKPLLLPTPWQVTCAVAQMAADPDFWLVVAGSLMRIVAGFLLGLFFGAVLAVLCAVLPLLQPLVALPMGIVKASPVASFAILALLFIGNGWFSVFISFLMVLPIAWSNIFSGIAATDRGLLEMAQLYRFPVGRVVRRIYFPSVLPYLLSAVRVGLGFAWKSGIAGEVIALPRGSLGTQLYNAKVYLETANLFGLTVVIVLLSLALEWLATRILKWLEGARR